MIKCSRPAICNLTSLAGALGCMAVFAAVGCGDSGSSTLGSGGTSGGTSGGASGGGTAASPGSGAGGSAGCPQGQMLCNGVCVSVSTDANNCGACGTACGTGQGCINGACTCPGELTSCSGACVDTSQDPANCGACGTICSNGGLCTQGACQCQSGLTSCPSGCANLQSDGNNCGACGTVCSGGAVCSAGSCQSGCTVTGETQCGTSCVALASDPLNCGSCGAACPSGQLCVNGACTCSSAQTLCGGACVNTSTDASNCGSCGNVCPSGQTCTSGACACPAGQAMCGGSCIDTSGDPDNCGSCGVACADGATCTNGICSGGSGTGGSSGTGSSGTGGLAVPGDCGSINSYPFGCEFAWGAPSNGNNSSYLDFVSTWIGDENNGGLSSWSASATNNYCQDCELVRQIASSNSMVVFYTYFIGFQACRQGGYCDCNTSSPPNLCSNGAQWIRDNREQLVNAYGQYAAAVYAESPNKPTIWWLEGDFIQYSYEDQSNPLSMADLGQLALDITCSIKSHQPNAVVAMNHSPWISNEQADDFWSAMPMQALDLAWVQGPGDSGTYVNSGTYNATSANYSWLYQKIGRPIMAETSFASSGQNDRWTTASASAINSRISEGVIAVLVNNPPSSYQSAISGFGSLNSVCQ